MGTSLGPKYIPYTYMDPLGTASIVGGSPAGEGSEWAELPQQFLKEAKPETLTKP